VRRNFGIGLAELKATQLSASPSKAMASEEARVIMREIKSSLMVAILVAGLATGAFAQKSGNDNRPPKETRKVVEKPKNNPPPGNGNQGNSNKHGKPD